MPISVRIDVVAKVKEAVGEAVNHAMRAVLM